MLHRFADRQAAMHPTQRIVQPCTPANPCARCSLVKVIAYRFSVFARAFGRIPKPYEPIFFPENATAPTAACRADLRRQVEEAVAHTAVRLAPVLELLGLDADDR